jgi:hypothetical protein
MALYDDAARLYDDATILYDGLTLGTPITLIVAEADVTDYLAVQSLSVRTATHGNSLGTLDAKLNDPPALPAVEDPVDLYVGLERRYRGTLKATTINEFRGGHLFASFSAQDSGPDEGAIPTAAPFGLSDDPDGSATKGYETLTAMSRTTEGGSPKTTYQAVVRDTGLWSGQNVEVTSANYGLTAEEFTIVEVGARWPNRDAPEYTVTLGDPLVTLAQVVTEHEIPDGAITETKISDGAISTPKLAANAVTAAKVEAGAIDTAHLAATATISRVSNDGAEVVIDGSGIAVTSGAISVTNGSGTVIIDGTSNMFKIAAEGTQSRSSNSGDDLITSSTTLTGLGALAGTPAHLGYISSSSAVNSTRSNGYAQADASDFAATTSGGSPTASRVMATIAARMATSLNGSSQAVVALRITNADAGAQTWHAKYYILKEAAL